MRNRKQLLLMGIICSGLILSLAAYKSPSGSDEGGKNLKVLPSNITKDSLINLMEGYNAALGVKCGFCHAQNDTTKKLNFASDAKKEKGFARHMIVMTQKINAAYFNFEGSSRADTINVVTCGTCHRGKAEPEAFVIPAHEKK